MKISALIFLTPSTFVVAGNAIAGHEWTDGTMGPPGQSYDTSMPIFPSVKRISPKPNEAPSQACDSRALASAGAAPSASAMREASQQHQNDVQSTAASREREICHNQKP